MKHCRVDGCTRPVKYPAAGLCGACYHGMYYWTRRTPAELMRHLDRLHVVQARLELMAPARRLRRRA